MSLRAVCPHCKKVYTVGLELRGKRVRCKDCRRTFVVADPTEDDEPGSRDEKRPEARPRRRKVRRRKSAGVSMSWIVAGGLAGVVLLAATVGVLIWVLRGKPPSVAQATNNQPAAGPAQDESDVLAEALAELDRLEPGWRMADLQRKRTAIPDRENSALQVQAAKQLLPADWPSWPPEFEEGLNNHPPTEELTPKQVATLRAELRRASAALAEARKLVDMPSGRLAIDWSGDVDKPLDQLIQYGGRPVTRLLEFDALLRAQEETLDGALTSCRAALNAGRSIADEHTLIAQLIRIACRVGALLRIERVLNQGEPSEKALAALQLLLEEDAEQPLLRYATLGERVYQDWYMQAVQEGRKKADEVAAIDLHGVGERFLRDAKDEMQPGSVKRIRAALLRLATQCVAISRLPIEDQRPRIEALTATTREMPKSVQLNWMSFEKVAGACRRSVAEMRCAVVAVALERYRQKHRRWPAELGELVPAPLPKVPLDAMDGRPLRYRRLADGVVVYSVGLDGTDDGGNLHRDATKPGTDRGLRLWDVSHRRRPRGGR